MVVRLCFMVMAMERILAPCPRSVATCLSSLLAIFDGWPPQGASLDEPERAPVFNLHYLVLVNDLSPHPSWCYELPVEGLLAARLQSSPLPGRCTQKHVKPRSGNVKLLGGRGALPPAGLGRRRDGNDAKWRVAMI
jgi:hypothetical protein